MRNFLLGVLVGVTLMGSVCAGISVYASFNERLSAVEGYIVGIEMLRRAR